MYKKKTWGISLKKGRLVVDARSSLHSGRFQFFRFADDQKCLIRIFFSPRMVTEYEIWIILATTLTWEMISSVSLK